MLSLKDKTYEVSKLPTINVAAAVAAGVFGALLFSNLVIGIAVGAASFVFLPEYLPTLLEKTGFKPVDTPVDEDSDV